MTQPIKAADFVAACRYVFPECDVVTGLFKPDRPEPKPSQEAIDAVIELTKELLITTKP